MKYLVIFILILAFVTITPLLILWSLNTLFPLLAIPYTIETWSAAVLLSTFVFAKR